MPGIPIAFAVLLQSRVSRDSDSKLEQAVTALRSKLDKLTDLAVAQRPTACTATFASQSRSAFAVPAMAATMLSAKSAAFAGTALAVRPKASRAQVR